MYQNKEKVSNDQRPRDQRTKVPKDQEERTKCSILKSSRNKIKNPVWAQIVEKFYIFRQSLYNYTKIELFITVFHWIYNLQLLKKNIETIG